MASERAFPFPDQQFHLVCSQLGNRRRDPQCRIADGDVQSVFSGPIFSCRRRRGRYGKLTVKRETEAALPNATMTTVSVQLTPETEQRLRRQASRRGESLEAYLSHLAEKGAEGETQVPDMLAQGIAWLHEPHTRGGAGGPATDLGCVTASARTPAGEDTPRCR